MVVEELDDWDCVQMCCCLFRGSRIPLPYLQEWPLKYIACYCYIRKRGIEREMSNPR